MDKKLILLRVITINALFYFVFTALLSYFGDILYPYTSYENYLRGGLVFEVASFIFYGRAKIWVLGLAPIITALYYGNKYFPKDNPERVVKDTLLYFMIVPAGVFLLYLLYFSVGVIMRPISFIEDGGMLAAIGGLIGSVVYFLVGSTISFIAAKIFYKIKTHN